MIGWVVRCRHATITEDELVCNAVVHSGSDIDQDAAVVCEQYAWLTSDGDGVPRVRLGWTGVPVRLLGEGDQERRVGGEVPVPPSGDTERALPRDVREELVDIERL